MDLRRALGFAAVALLALAACRDKSTATTAASDASTSILFDSTADRAWRYRYVNWSDFLGRFMVVVPKGFKRTEVRSCNVVECLAEVDFEGDGIEIRAFALPAAEERPTLEDDKAAAAKAKETVSNETTFPGGWFFDTTSEDGKTYAFHRRQATFISPVRVEIRGPIAQKDAIDEVASRLHHEYLISTTRPAVYCRDLPWSPPEARTQRLQTWHGTLGIAQGEPPVARAPEGDKTPYVLTLDEPVCGGNGRAVWELEVFTKGKPDLKSLVGQHIRAEGYFDAASGPPDYRPIFSAIDLASAEPRDR